MVQDFSVFLKQFLNALLDTIFFSNQLTYLLVFFALLGVNALKIEIRNLLCASFVLPVHVTQTSIYPYALQSKLQHLINKHLLNNIEFILFAGVVSEQIHCVFLLNLCELQQVVKCIY